MMLGWRMYPDDYNDLLLASLDVSAEQQRVRWVTGGLDFNGGNVLERQRKGGKTELWAVSTISLCMGAGVASGLPFLKGMAEGRLEPRYAAAFLAAATVAFIAVEISKARALAFLAKRIGGMLEKKADTGQL